jgi:hypothetical protein
MRVFRSTAAFVVMTCAALSACADSPTASQAVPGQMTLSIATTQPAGVLYSRNDAVMATQESLSLTAAQFVLSRVEAVPAGTGACAPDDGVAHPDDACSPVSASPTVVSLPLDGSLPVATTTILPFGSYAAVEANLRGVSQSDASWAAFTQANPNFANGVSVRVAGTYTDANGTARPFVFTSIVNQGLEFDFPTAVIIDSTGTNLTMAVNLVSWFRDATTGALLDPNNPSNQSQIESNIRTSFQVFKDANRDGRADAQ